MTQKIDKKGIVEALKAYTERKGGQNKAANSIKGVSSATLSQMAAGNWEHISDEMWRKVARALGVSAEIGGQDTFPRRAIDTIWQHTQMPLSPLSLLAYQKPK